MGDLQLRGRQGATREQSQGREHDEADASGGGDLAQPEALRQPAGRQLFDPELAHGQLNGVVADMDATAVQKLGPHAVGAVGAARGLVDPTISPASSVWS